MTEDRGRLPNRDSETLEALLHEFGYLGLLSEVDGRLTAATTEAIRGFQRDHGLIADGIAGPKTWAALFAKDPSMTAEIARKSISQADIEAVADHLDLSVAHVRAVYKVEAAGAGFIGLEPKILFEGHIFWRRLLRRGIDPERHQAGNEDVLYPSWDSSHYRGGLAEHARLAKASVIHADAAHESASWGLFQIMGYHAESLGYGDVTKFVAEMRLSERAQLDAFARFVFATTFRGKSLLVWLRERNWAMFAAGYNGPGYAQHHYDRRLRDAYVSFGGQ